MSEVMKLARRDNEVIIKATGLKIGIILSNGAIKFTKTLEGRIEFDKDLDQYLSDKRSKVV